MGKDAKKTGNEIIARNFALYTFFFASLPPLRLCVCILALFWCGDVVARAGFKRAGTQAIARVVHVAQPEKDASRYRYVAFQVPRHTSRISISYGYDHANGANALDIGLFDARWHESKGDLSGFRGWSGGRRAEFFISRDDATPGYVPGDLPAGTWHIILGLYRVVPSGVDVSFQIDIETNEGIPTKLALAPKLSGTSSRLSLPAANPMAETESTRPTKQALLPRWISGDLHLHTVHSDGDWSIAALIAAAREAGLEFICVTDHNTMSHHAEIDHFPETAESLLVMRGEEITTYGGHTNAWGLPTAALIDFRIRPGDTAAMARIVAQAHRRGAIISINHPFALCGGCDWSYDPEAHDFDAIEVWNGAWDKTDERALSLWDGLLQKGRRITAVASSDSHRPTSFIGRPATHVAIKGGITQQKVLNAIRVGRSYLTSEPTQPAIKFDTQSPEDFTIRSIGERLLLAETHRLRFSVQTGGLPPQATVSLISQGRTIHRFSSEAGNTPEFVEVNCMNNSYFRLEIRDQTGTMLALTNPIYVEVRSPR